MKSETDDIARNFERAKAHNNRGVALAHKSQHAEAIVEYREALRLENEYADAHNNLGAALGKLSKIDEAGEQYREALRINPRHPAARNNLGTWLMAKERVEEAEEAFREALRLKPGFVDALCNLGIAVLELGRAEEAAEAYQQALKIDPDYNEAHWCTACLLLRNGDYRRGWVEYEWRWRTSACRTPRRNYPEPNWLGEELNGRRILLYTEQGFGDSIQFIRYASLIARRGGRVILNCQEALASLMKGVAGIEQIVFNTELPPFDVYCPLMTLPLIFSTRVETIPADIPYIKVDPALAETWRGKVEQSTDRVKVGLVWAGGTGYINDHKRSISLAKFASLARAADVRFYSLQKGPAAAQATEPPPGMELIDLTPDLNDFADTAAMISQLDLVIAVDTAVAHLAGALGKPVWVLLPKNSDWRWLKGRDDSPWYPTMRLFRQTVRGDWTDVIERVAEALTSLRRGGSTNELTAPRQLSTADAIALAYQHHQAGRLSEAGGIYRQILAQQPNNTDVLHLLGLAAKDAGKRASAIQCFRRAVAINPNIPEFQNSLALALAGAGKYDEAIAAYREVIRLCPDFPDAHYNLGNALLKTGQSADAVAAYRQATRLRPDHCESHINLGDALVQNQEFEEAVAAFKSALEINPSHAQAQMNLGLALIEVRQLDQAAIAAKKAIELDPESADAHWLIASLCLLRGDFEQGLAEYEWRWRVKNAGSPRPILSQPRWNGEELHGRTILLHAEQGLGDTIQFIRYASLVAARGGRVIVECPPALSCMIQGVAGVEQVIVSQPRPAFDMQCPLMSLPLVFKTRLDSIPAEIPYLTASPAPTATWARKLGKPDGRRRVGLVWAGGPAYKNDLARSTTLSQFAPLARVKNAIFHSLQKGPAAAQAAAPPAGMEWVDLTAELIDFADTAGLIANLDLVISVDTAVAHLAGALGKPVWLMLPYNPDWRWMLDRTDSPWYPTMRLFRQSERGDWAGVVREMAEELAV